MNAGCHSYPVVGFECRAIENCWPSTATIWFPSCIGAGVAVGPAVGIAEGVSDADVEAEVVVLAVVDAACDALLAAWLLLVDDDVQPAIDNEATITSAIKASDFLTIQAPLTEERIKRVQRRRHSLSVVV